MLQMRYKAVPNAPGRGPGPEIIGTAMNPLTFIYHPRYRSR